MNNIGIIGQGFVGTAIKEGMQHALTVDTYDKYKSELSTCNSVGELCKKTKIIFVCLPTPMRTDGSCDLSIVESTIEEINKHSNFHIAVIKSTIPPGTTERLNRTFKNVSVVFSPEFLTEANFLDDFKNQNRIIIGGPRSSRYTGCGGRLRTAPIGRTHWQRDRQRARQQDLCPPALRCFFCAEPPPPSGTGTVMGSFREHASTPRTCTLISAMRKCTLWFALELGSR